MFYPLKVPFQPYFRPILTLYSNFFANPGPIQRVQDLIFSGIILIVCAKEWLFWVMAVDHVLPLKTSVSTFFQPDFSSEKRLKRKF